MKNIHILPTDKPSRLSILNNGKLNFGAEIMSSSNSKPQHIYITSDEEIKEGDWVYNIVSKTKFKATKQLIDLINKPNVTLTTNKKIILTTDQDLIADGVQAINDEFLEWFVKNPSCERVVVEPIPNNSWGFDLEEPMTLGYKIILSQEEPKQEKERGITITHVGKKETLEEAAKLYADNGDWEMFEEDTSVIRNTAFIKGSQWQSERMYSEEEVIAIVEKSRVTGLTAEYLLLTEQFKKKQHGKK
jgi:hypothetical protein